VSENAESVEDSVSPTDQAVAKPGRRRGRIAAVATSVLLAAAVVAGVGVTVVTVDGADRDPGAPVWKLPAGGPAKAKAASEKGLGGLLVPYGADGWGRGPDLGEYGYDARLSGARATALAKEALSGLPRSRRKELERRIDKQHISGIAMRSYVSTTELSSVYTHQASTVAIQLAQLESRSAVGSMARSQQELFDALGIFEDGPKIEGHKDAGCYLASSEEKDGLDSMYCVAAQGNVLVTLIATSAEPLQKTGIAMLLREQLDRIEEPGESV
jgi:hypothetical protein